MGVLFGLLLCLTCERMVAVAATPVDVELVLAVDVSRSMDPQEFALQRAGYVAALRHPDFLKAVQGGLNGRIALSYFEWAGDVRPDRLLTWQIVDSAESASAFADRLQALPDDTFRGTSISAALDFGASLFANEFDGYRRVIDISGDGPNNVGAPVKASRDAAVADGIVINGLPILVRPSPTFKDLGRYYAECVTGGPGSFVLPIRSAEEFAEAIRRKLVLEVSGSPQAVPVIRAAGAAIDCEIGERDRRFFSDPYFPQLDR